MMIILKSDVNTPLYIQIYEQLKEEIMNGSMPAGSKLPSTRNLAKTLAVGRNTVENAYLQLTSEGYVESKQGSGFIIQNVTAVNDLNKKSQYDLRDEESKVPEEKITNQQVYNFQYGHLSGEDFPLRLWKKVSNKAITSLTADDMTRYSYPKGEYELRNEVKAYLRKSRGVLCDEEQIIICAGFEYALTLLCQLFRGDLNQIALEEPGYFGARQIFCNNGYEVLPISVEQDGLNLTSLEECPAKIVYVTPSHQFPTGAVMPIQKRVRLLEWAQRKECMIIEDDYDSEIRYNSRPIPSINSIAANGNVIYIGTMSKALSPSLRISYLVLPKKLMEKYAQRFEIYQSPVAVIQQRMLTLFMKLGYWESHLRKICNANKRKYDSLIHGITQYMGDQVIIHGKNAGLHILLESKQGLSESDMIEKAKAYGVLVYPVSVFWMNKSNYLDNMVLLGFGNLSEEEILQGIKEFSKALRI